MSYREIERLDDTGTILRADGTEIGRRFYHLTIWQEMHDVGGGEQIPGLLQIEGYIELHGHEGMQFVMDGAELILKLNAAVTSPRNLGAGAWDQFLIGKRNMLAEYRRAQEHSAALKVQTHHGNVAEAAVRSWLEAFLPKRYGITSGYIRGQRLRHAHDYAHFDVIVYDQVESPILWVDSNPDKSPSGRSRVIPAEFVRAVFETKAAFHYRAIEEALAKLHQLDPLMAGTDAKDEKYPTYLASNTVLAMLFFELRRDHRNDFKAMESVRKSIDFKRVMYGPIILSGDNRPDNETGLARITVSAEPVEAIELSDGLLSHIYFSATSQDGSQHVATSLTWSEMHFSEFAFDLLALMNGAYRPGYLSSFHGFR